MWDCVRSNNGIMALLELLHVKTPITDADSIAHNAGPRIVADQVAALDLNNPETIVVSFCPAAYTAELVKAIPTLRTPLAGSRGIGEQRGRIARLTRDELLG